ncbi:hypothetical protein Tco_0667523 [Tanacetum coccineum]
MAATPPSSPPPSSSSPQQPPYCYSTTTTTTNHLSPIPPSSSPHIPTNEPIVIVTHRLRLVLLYTHRALQVTDIVCRLFLVGASFTQGTISSIPIGGSISPEGFLASSSAAAGDHCYGCYCYSYSIDCVDDVFP